MTVGFNRRDANALLRIIDRGPDRKPRDGRYREVPRYDLFLNSSGETVPAWGVMRVTDVVEHNTRIKFEITKPDDTAGLFVFNGPTEVEDNEGGVCFAGPIIKGLYTGTDPSNGDVLGVDGWTLSASGDAVFTVKVDGVVDSTAKTLLVVRSRLIPITFARQGYQRQPSPLEPVLLRLVRQRVRG